MNDVTDWLLILRWRLHVCLIGWGLHRVWVWGCLDLNEWYEMRSCERDPEDAYIEGWCRE